ncbi:hypothetical protein MBH78_18920 [Oceanimonas sp. NS1]|nr:hypothetical protein [Oceanimonas sp. NS1]
MINIVAFGEDDELQIALRGMGSVFTWPQFCTLYPPSKVINHHRLHVESPDSKWCSPWTLTMPPRPSNWPPCWPD